MNASKSESMGDFPMPADGLGLESDKRAWMGEACDVRRVRAVEEDLNRVCGRYGVDIVTLQWIAVGKHPYSSAGFGGA